MIVNPSSSESPSVESSPAAAGFRPPPAETKSPRAKPVRNPAGPVKLTERAYDGASSKRNTYGAVARSGVRYAKHLARLEGTLAPDWAAEGRRAHAEGLTSDEAAVRFAQLWLARLDGTLSS